MPGAAECDFDVCKNVLRSTLRLRATSGGQLNANRLLLQSAMSTDSLSGMAREHYIRKLQCLYSMVGENEEKCLESLDPYKLPEDKWVDDVSKWPPVEYPDLYRYLIEAPGESPEKSSKHLRAWRHTTTTRGERLDLVDSNVVRHNIIYVILFFSGWVHTVFYYDLGTDHSCCLLKVKLSDQTRRGVLTCCCSAI